MAKSNAHKMTDREVEIGQKIHTAVLAISNDLTMSADAKDAKKAADEAVETGRLPVILAVAEMSRLENWTEAEAMWGCEYAANVKGNDDRTSKTIATFCSEMKSVTSPKVRDEVPTIVRACELAWQAETDAIELDKKNAERPLREFAKRKYHLIITAIKEQRLGQIYITDPASVVAWAEANDPAKNPDKVAAIISDMAEKLGQIFVFFADADINECAGALARIDAKALRAARVHPDMNVHLPKPPAKAPEKPVQAGAPVPAAPPAPIPLAPVQQAPAPASDGVAEGVADMDSFMNDSQTVHLAEAAD